MKAISTKIVNIKDGKVKIKKRESESNKNQDSEYQRRECENKKKRESEINKNQDSDIKRECIVKEIE